jgi:hypothetical protein
MKCEIATYYICYDHYRCTRYSYCHFVVQSIFIETDIQLPFVAAMKISGKFIVQCLWTRQDKMKENLCSTTTNEISSRGSCNLNFDAESKNRKTKLRGIRLAFLLSFE